MKKLLFTAITAMVIIGCSQSENDITNDGTSNEIVLRGNVETTAVVSRAAINKGDALTDIQFVRVDGEGIGTLADFTTIKLTGDMAAGGKITFDHTQYYPADGTTNANILGFYPAANSIAGGVASMIITGEEDVLYAVAKSGSKAVNFLSLSFAHKLTQFKFVIKRDAASTESDIKAVSVLVKDANTTFDMNLPNGMILNWATPISTIAPITDGTATIAGAAETAGIMLQPDMASLTLTVKATGYAAKDVTIQGTDGGKFLEGNAYTITLTFKGTEIAPSGAIAEWTAGTAGGADIE